MVGAKKKPAKPNMATREIASVRKWLGTYFPTSANPNGPMTDTPRAEPGKKKVAANNAVPICRPLLPRMLSIFGASHMELKRPKALHSSSKPKVASLTLSLIFKSGM